MATLVELNYKGRKGMKIKVISLSILHYVQEYLHVILEPF